MGTWLCSSSAKMLSISFEPEEGPCVSASMPEPPTTKFFLAVGPMPLESALNLSSYSAICFLFKVRCPLSSNCFWLLSSVFLKYLSKK